MSKRKPIEKATPWTVINQTGIVEMKRRKKRRIRKTIPARFPTIFAINQATGVCRDSGGGISFSDQKTNTSVAQDGKFVKKLDNVDIDVLYSNLSLARCQTKSKKETTMLETVKEMLREMAADDELYGLIAQCTKKLFDALVTASFTEEQAIEIVASQGIGIKSS